MDSEIDHFQQDLQDRGADADFDKIADMNITSFYEMKKSLVEKRKSLCTIEQIAKELNKTPKEMAEFEAYYSDPTLSQVRTYALAIMEVIHIRVEEFSPDAVGNSYMPISSSSEAYDMGLEDGYNTVESSFIPLKESVSATRRSQ